MPFQLPELRLLKQERRREKETERLRLPHWGAGENVAGADLPFVLQADTSHKPFSGLGP